MRKIAIVFLLLTLLVTAGCGAKHTMALGSTAVTLQPGDTYRLDAACSDEKHSAYVWQSSDIGIAHVDKNGCITAVAEGKATITAACEAGRKAASASCTVTVNVCRIAFSFDNKNNAIMLGEEAALTAYVYVNDERTILPVEWTVSGDADCAAVVLSDNAARITARAVGTLVLKASCRVGESECSAEYTVTLTDAANYCLRLSAESVRLYPDESCQITAELLPAAEGTQIKWLSSNPQVASVSADGTITATKAGSAVVTAAAVVPGKDEVKAPCLVTVDRNEYDVSIADIDRPIYASDVVELRAELSKNGESCDGKVVWSINDESVASVEKDRLAAHCAGKIKLTAAYESPEGDRYTDETELEILPNVYALTLISPVTELNMDDTMALEAELTRNGAPFDGHITWFSSDNAVIWVADGEITALGAGTAVITAAYNEPRAEGGATYAASVEIKVTGSAYSLYMNSESISLRVGESAPVTATVYKGGKTVDGVSIRYYVKNIDVAVFNGGGVTAVGAGDTLLIASWTDPEGEEHTAQCTISAETPYYMVLEPTDVSLEIGGEIQIIATTLQKFDDGSTDECYEGEVRWQSSDDSVEVAAGVAAAKAASDDPVIITAIWIAPDGAVCRAQCIVTVIEPET